MAHKLPQPVKLLYHGQYFCYERPQAGRYRKFTRSAPSLSGRGAEADAELFILHDGFLRDSGAGHG